MTAWQFRACVCALFFAFLAPLTAVAQNGSGSAFGKSVDVSIDSAFSLITVEANSGPIPTISESTSPDFNESDQLIGVDVNANVYLVSDLLPLPPAVLSILDTGILNVSTTGDTSPDVESRASVADVDLELLGTAVLPLLALGITADEVVSTASASGS